MGHKANPKPDSYCSTKCFRAPSPLSHKNGKRKWSKRKRSESKKLLKDEVNEFT